MKSFADFGIDTNGKHGIEVKVTCPQCSHTRKKKRFPCLNVNTDKGVWHCWHCDWSGSLAKGEDLRSNPFRWAQKVYKKPVYQPLTELPAKVVAWFAQRGIPETVLARYQVGYGPVYMPQIEEEVNAIQFPYLRAGEVVNIKYRDGQKHFRQVGGAEKVLYGLDDVAPTTVWVEGELDKLALAVAGIPNAVSVPDGAPAPESTHYETKFEYLDTCKPQIDAIQTHILAVDADAPGQKLEEELARRLGRERCLRVQWPTGCKDANEVLLTHGADVLRTCIEEARPFPITGVYEVADIADRIDAIYEQGLPGGEATGWTAMDGLYSVRPGEWTVLTGIPNSGKSEWLDALMVNLARRLGWCFAVFSPENQPLELHASKILEKWAGKPFRDGPTPRMDPQTKDAGKAWMQDHFKFVLPEEPTLDSVLNLARELVYRHGIKGLVIDPWNELEHSRPANLTESEYISQCLTRARRFAREHGVHLWIVAHPTKLRKDEDGNYPVPTPYDISGSAHWRNKADNALSVWRGLNDKHNQVVQVHVQKVRFREVGSVGTAELVYERATGRYFDMSDVAAMNNPRREVDEELY